MGGVARARPQAREAPVDHRGPLLHRGQGVADGQAEVVVGVEAHLAGEGGAQRRDPGPDLVGDHGPGRVHDVDRVGPIGLHELRLLHQLRGLLHVRHHQEAGDVHADVPGQADVLGGDVGLGGVGGDAGQAGPPRREPSPGRP